LVCGARARLRGPAHQAFTLYERTLKRCARAGAVRAEAETPLEFSRALAERSFPGAEVVADVTAVYYRARFGELSPPPGLLADLEGKLDRIGQAP
jgi:hypothetical protein